MSDQCAVGPDGKLRDAEDIVFYNDVDDLIPIGAPSSSASAPTSIKDFSLVALVVQVYPLPEQLTQTTPKMVNVRLLLC
jgi:hypothetical protein